MTYHALSVTGGSSKMLAFIGSDGVFHFTAEPTDENTQAFVKHLEAFLKRRITGIQVSPPESP